MMFLTPFSANLQIESARILLLETMVSSMAMTNGASKNLMNKGVLKRKITRFTGEHLQLLQIITIYKISIRIESSRIIIEGHSLAKICSFLNKTKNKTKIFILHQQPNWKKKGLKKTLGFSTLSWYNLSSILLKGLSASTLLFTLFGNTQFTYTSACSKSLKW